MAPGGDKPGRAKEFLLLVETRSHSGWVTVGRGVAAAPGPRSLATQSAGTGAAAAPSPNVPVAQSSSAAAAPPPGAFPASADIRQDLAAFDRMFRLPAARIQTVTTLAGAASPWQATGEEVFDLEVAHTVAPAATLRLVLLPPAPWTAPRPRPRT